MATPKLCQAVVSRVSWPKRPYSLAGGWGCRGCRGAAMSAPAPRLPGAGSRRLANAGGRFARSMRPEAAASPRAAPTMGAGPPTSACPRERSPQPPRAAGPQIGKGGGPRVGGQNERSRPEGRPALAGASAGARCPNAPTEGRNGRRAAGCERPASRLSLLRSGTIPPPANYLVHQSRLLRARRSSTALARVPRLRPFGAVGV